MVEEKARLEQENGDLKHRLRDERKRDVPGPELDYTFKAARADFLTSKAVMGAKQLYDIDTFLQRAVGDPSNTPSPFFASPSLLLPLFSSSMVSLVSHFPPFLRRSTG